MISMRVRDDGALDWLPGIDVKAACGAPQT